ncbi:MAG: pyrimidine/purine nucleoside phosphorylase [Candidatus Accumulibacter sp.]|uniref:pyrimidine/purine nucleoside phosphorylase n=1 Tax=Accumulibacter sp. TaxID=2053492 RepID=UPI001A4E964B|nr:pyrimidine/purine nucleoside phosphorylase [Accumulibacter sp.]MBL8394333.1 pyrimidine/purine nucleoside phosphorylase [Accumulibacter sp.]
MSQFDQVSVVKQANVYFDGRCVSHTVLLADGSRKTLGVILPATLRFNTGVAEVMEGVAGSCRVRRQGESGWTVYGAGESFAVPPDSSFEIACDEPYHYVCHFA